MTKLLPYQSDAVEKCEAIIRRYRGALLADDVGLGKTFVAAELLTRASRRGEGVKVVVPAGLISMWERIDQEFAIGAAIFSHDAIANLLIAPGAWSDSLVVVDEAHHFRHPEIARSQALARLSVGTRMLLISATPVNNGAADIATLVQLFADDAAFQLVGCPSLESALSRDDQDELRCAVGAVMVRRTAETIDLPAGLPAIVPKRIRYDSDPRTAELLRAIGALEFPLVARAVSRPLMHILLERRLASSIVALAESVKRMRTFCFRAIEAGSSGLTLSRRQFDRLFGGHEADAPFQDLLFGEFWGMKAGEADVARLRREISKLDDVTRIASSLRDEKLEAMSRYLDQLQLPALIFSTARATALALYQMFRDRMRCALVTGDRCLDRRAMRTSADHAFAEFQDGHIDLIVATDRAAEGVNLQRAASVVHYDLPWNPVRIEQRNGRARRLGSKRRVVEVLFVLPRDHSARHLLLTLAAKRRTAAALLPASPVHSELDSGVMEVESAEHGFVVADDLGELHAVINGRVVDAQKALRQVGGSFTKTVKSDEAASLLADATRTLQSIVRVPPFLAARRPQALLSRKLHMLGLLDRELARLLTLRYRRGVEQEMYAFAAGPLDEMACASLREMLRHDAPADRAPRAVARAIFLRSHRAD